MDTFTHEIYVSPQGNDAWYGSYADPLPDKSDGPCASIYRARDLIRNMKKEGATREPVTVWIRGGRYHCDEPIIFTPQDSGPVTYKAYPGEVPVIDGGITITDWKETTVNGRTVWVSDIAWLLEKKPSIKTLYCNDRTCTRARLPKKGYYYIDKIPQNLVRKHDTIHNGMFDGTNYFYYKNNDIAQWKNLQDIEIIALHTWMEERMPVDWVDEKSRLVKSTRRSALALSKGDRYYVENVFEALSEPGEWYLDRASAQLYYIPMEDETITECEITAGLAYQLIKIIGDPEHNRNVSFLTFDGLHFEHTDWQQPTGWGTRYDPDIPRERQLTQDSFKFLVTFLDPSMEYASGVQSAFNVPGVITMQGADSCGITNCTIAHCGWYALQLAEGCTGIHISKNSLHDLGAGGIIADGADHDGLPSMRTGHSYIADNHIYNIGGVFHSACGIALIHSFNNTVRHNTIHDTNHSGISSGWIWGYGMSITRENLIEKNHIYNLGNGVLSDFGGIYTLGVQPGTIIRENCIHDLQKCEYGSWCIYPDEGSSHILIEKNICYNSNSQPYHQHFGRENIIRNNIFAFGQEGQIALSRGIKFRWLEKNARGDGRVQSSFNFERNIVLTDSRPVYLCGTVDETAQMESRSFKSDCNCFWDINGKELFFGNGRHGECAKESMRSVFSLAQIQKMGYDLHSIAADPGFADAAHGDFTLKKDSPVFALGFEPIDLSDAGVRR